MCQNSSIRSALSIQYWLVTDSQTDGHRTIAILRYHSVARVKA